LWKSVWRGSTICTDDWEGDAVWAQKGYIHEDCPGREHSFDQWLDGTAFAGMPRVNWVAVLKRWLWRTHAGAVSQAQLRYYLDEFTLRFNARRCKDPGQLFESLMRQAVTTAPVGYRRVVFVIPSVSKADRRGCRHLAFVLYSCFPRCATTASRTL
jgi:hypothetical protein